MCVCVLCMCCLCVMCMCVMHVCCECVVCVCVRLLCVCVVRVCRAMCCVCSNILSVASTHGYKKTFQFWEKHGVLTRSRGRSQVSPMTDDKARLVLLLLCAVPLAFVY